MKRRPSFPTAEVYFCRRAVEIRGALAGDAADRGRLLGYMAGLAGGAILFQFATRGPAGLAGSWCDSLSAPYLAAFVVAAARSEEHTSELQSLMRISYAVFCLKKKKNINSSTKIDI